MPAFFFFFSPHQCSAERHPAAVYHCSNISNEAEKEIIASELDIKICQMNVKLHRAHQEKKKEKRKSLHGRKSFTTRPLAAWQGFMNAIWTFMHFPPLLPYSVPVWRGTECGKSSGATSGRGYCSASGVGWVWCLNTPLMLTSWPFSLQIHKLNIQKKGEIFY